jgi:DNA helicase II / ATP-dependent DNA helicase PcrA
VVPEALRYLRHNPGCEARRAYDHVIVDEYQDLNRAEQDLIQLLTGGRGIALVGDADQSIYHFRHANPDAIMTYKARYPDTHDEVLDECRRCPTRIVAIANHLIRHNYPEHSAPRLRPRPGNVAGEIHIVQWGDVNEEAVGLAKYVRTLVTNGVRPGEILILTPRRLLGYEIRDQIRKRGIAVHSFYHEEALEEDDAQQAFCLLSLLVDLEDRVALRWWLAHCSPSGRRNAYQVLRQHCQNSGMSPRDALEACATGKLDLPKTNALLARYRELMTRLNDLRRRPLPDLIDTLLPSGNDACSVLREAALLDLEKLESAAELLDCLTTAITQPTIPEKVDYVRVMSLHKAKGLTSEVTIISGCTQGLIPYVDRDQPPREATATLEEQRRLLYVAITRCTRTLVISSANQMSRKLAWRIGARVTRGRSAVARTIASQFFDELGPDAPNAKSGNDWARRSYAE